MTFGTGLRLVDRKNPIRLHFRSRRLFHKWYPCGFGKDIGEKLEKNTSYNNINAKENGSALGWQVFKRLR